MMICTRCSLLKHLGRQNDTWQHASGQKVLVEQVDQATGTPLMPNRTLPKYYSYSIFHTMGTIRLDMLGHTYLHGYGYRNTRIIVFYLLSMLLLLILQLLKPISPNSYQIFALEFIDNVSWAPLLAQLPPLASSTWEKYPRWKIDVLCYDLRIECWNWIDVISCSY